LTAIIVAPHVRKSFAVYSAPATVLRYSLTSMARNLARLPVLDVLEELVARQVDAASQHRCDALVLEREVVLLAGLARKRMRIRSPLDLDVAVAQRGEAVRAVLAPVALVAHAHEVRSQQRTIAASTFSRGNPGQREIAVDCRANRGQAARELRQAMELVLVALRAPILVIAILLAAAHVAARRLQMALVVRADPDVGPCGRYGETANASERRGVAHGAAARVDVPELRRRAAARDAGLVIERVAKARGCEHRRDGLGRRIRFRRTGPVLLHRLGSNCRGRRAGFLPAARRCGQRCVDARVRARASRPT
jgi:hypothetical protein